MQLLRGAPDRAARLARVDPVPPSTRAHLQRLAARSSPALLPTLVERHRIDRALTALAEVGFVPGEPLPALRARPAVH